MNAVSYVLTWLCAAFLVALVAFMAIAFVRSQIRKATRSGRLSLAVFAAASVVAILYGGIGGGVSFRFMSGSGLHNAGSRFDPETGIIHAVWTYDPIVQHHAFKWFYSYKYGGENKGPYMLPDALVSAGHAEYQMTIPDDQQLESFIVTCYTQYVPPVHVVTNGVYHMDGVMRSMDSTNSVSPKFVTPAIAIEMNFETGESRIVTPTNAPPLESLISLENLTEGD